MSRFEEEQTFEKIVIFGSYLSQSYAYYNTNQSTTKKYFHTPGIESITSGFVDEYRNNSTKWWYFTTVIFRYMLLLSPKNKDFYFCDYHWIDNTTVGNKFDDFLSSLNCL